jgi:hypothetical protein
VILDSTLTPDRAMPKLLLKNQSLYNWITYYEVCIPVERVGGIYSVPRVLPQLSGDVPVTNDDQAATMWPTNHDSWSNQPL